MSIKKSFPIFRRFQIKWNPSLSFIAFQHIEEKLRHGNLFASFVTARQVELNVSSIILHLSGPDVCFLFHYHEYSTMNKKYRPKLRLRRKASESIDERVTNWVRDCKHAQEYLVRATDLLLLTSFWKSREKKEKRKKLRNHFYTISREQFVESFKASRESFYCRQQIFILAPWKFVFCLF